MKTLGGFWVRFAARILDVLLVGAVIYALILLLSLDTQSPVVQGAEGLFTLLYFILLPAIWYGRTVGKRLLGIRIVRDDGNEVTIVDMLIREFLAGLIYVFSLGIAVIVSAFMVGARADKKAIHDIIAKTSVVYDRPVKE